MEQKQLFRKKSLERVSSPEQLNDYIRVANPGVWMVLIAVVALLVGVCIWGVLGHLDTAIVTAGICHDGVLTAYVPEAEGAKVKPGMTITASGSTAAVAAVSDRPSAMDAQADDYLLHLGDLAAGDWVYTVTADCALPDGVYPVTITVESVSPMSFVMN